MTGRIFKLVAAGLISLVIFVALSSVNAVHGQAQPKVDPALEAYILQASVQIHLFAPYTQPQVNSNARQYIMAVGLGTFSELEGEMVIVTHNHWGAALEEAEFVRFYDAQGKQLLELSGTDLRALVCSQDAGTLILIAPQSLVKYQSTSLARIGEPNKVASGSILVIAHQAPEQNGRITLYAARADSPASYKNVPVFKIHSLDNWPIVAGDSGGGIWLDGQLVGNMWGRASEDESEVGYGAHLNWPPLEVVPDRGEADEAEAFGQLFFNSA
jgi:hypothetical protein